MSTPIAPNVAQHLNYQNGMFLTAAYMTLEQNYFSNWFRLQNQSLYSAGVLSGMQVTQNNNSLAVAQGVAFDVNGNFLILPDNNGNPVGVPPNPQNPFYVWAVYPNTAAQTTPVVDAAAQLMAGNQLPYNGVALAQVEVDAKYQITAVIDIRKPVSSLLPSNVPPQANSLSLQRALQGQINVSGSGLQSAGATVSVPFYYLASQQAAFSVAPNVVATVQGSVPFALAVQPDLAQCTLSLTALGSTMPASGTIAVNWIALALS